MKPIIRVVESISYQAPGEQPTAVNLPPWSRRLESSEQPFVRIAQIGEQWQPLQTGWIERAGMLVLSNEATRFTRNPTEGQRHEAEARVIELAVWVGSEPVFIWRVRPGESMRGEPADLSLLRMRCVSGVARYKLALVPC